MISTALFVAALLHLSDAPIDTISRIREAAVAGPDSVALSPPTRPVPQGPVARDGELTRSLRVVDTGSVQRRKAIEYSDFYEKRATIHRVASYAIIPLFAAQYVLGQQLMEDDDRSESTRNLHSVVAGGVAGLFGLNTITGAWNLWDSRKDPAGRTRRYVHTALMLIADAGFVATGATANYNNRNTHRAFALGSMGLSVGSAAMMWFWKD